MKTRVVKFIRIALVAGVVCGVALCASAAGNSGAPDDLKLRPPYGELPPTFWQQHGPTLILATPAVVLIAAIFTWLMLRPRPAAIPPPEIQARRALEDFLSRPENGAVLSKISQILRGYLVAAFDLPPGEPTTAEFCRIISSQARIGAELSSAVSEFLRQCDERKFSPQPPAEPLGGASRALELVALGEARRAQLRQSAIA
jgi:hypothetical protein